jgi:hypothetical protein
MREKLRAEGKKEEAAALDEQIKVDLLITEGKVAEALALAQRFGHEPHDDKLRKEQLHRLKIDNFLTIDNPGVAGEIAKQAYKDAGGMRSTPVPDWHKSALDLAKPICAKRPITQEALVDDVYDDASWKGNPPSKGRMKIFFRECENDGRLVRTKP